ncbi:MAG: ATP-grasp domain-containing protein [Actinomycetota bacterium]|nr:ATP-grasp domain-containing protein [Actinomycetota bacterium]
MSIRKLLIANRGEIAVRTIWACRELGIETVAVYSEADRAAMHRRLANESYEIGPAPAAESYLNIEKMIEVLKRSGADAVHPGYGFLAENAAFARAVEEAEAVWVGPPSEAMELMGSKVAAKRLAEEAGIPTVPGYSQNGSPERLAEEAERIGYPVLVKASAGGGGRGMRGVERPEDFRGAVESAMREAQASFGDSTVFLEKLIVNPRHIEIQVIADNHGNFVHLGERDCSIQRRHQKVVEEAPSPAITDELREELGAAAVRLAEAAGYRNAGTVEFLLDGDDFYFLEMNTRLQVEHPVTEQVTGLDLLHLQLAVAAGEPLPITQDDVRMRGSAIEVRLYAEDPETALPSGGKLFLFEPPKGPGIRNDVGFESGDEVPLDYDPMLAKLIVYGPDRAAAVKRLRQALKGYAVLGVTTNLTLLRLVVDHESFAAGETSTGFLETHGLIKPPREEVPVEIILAAAVGELCRENPFSRDPFEAGPWYPNGANRLRYRVEEDEECTVGVERVGRRRWLLDVDGREEAIEALGLRGGRLYLQRGGSLMSFGIAFDGGDVLISLDGHGYRVSKPGPLNLDDLGPGSGSSDRTSLTAPMPGTVIKVLVKEGDEVEARQPILVLEAMKMEQSIEAPYAGVVRELPYEEGSKVPGGATLAEIEGLKEEEGNDPDSR